MDCQRFRVAMMGVAVVAGLVACSESSGEADFGRWDPVPYQFEPGMDWGALRDQAIAERGEQMLAAGELESLPEDVEFVRYVELGEIAEVRVRCLRDLGFDAEVTRDGGVAYPSVPTDQLTAMYEAIYRCEVMFPLHPRFNLGFSEQQLELLYGYFVRVSTPCLRREGYHVDDPPSLETFIATYLRGGRPVPDDFWLPYDQVVVSGEEWYRIYEVCPPTATVGVLYGEVP